MIDGYRLMSRRSCDRNTPGEFLHFASFAEAGCHSASDIKLEHLENLLSSAAERRAHNPGVGGSKPPGGIYSNSPALQKLVVIKSDNKLDHTEAGIAQRQSVYNVVSSITNTCKGPNLKMVIAL